MAAAEKAGTIACCASLLVHAAIVLWGLRAYVRDADVALRHVAPQWRVTSAQEWVAGESAEIARETAPVLPEPPEIDRYTKFGEAEGKGEALDSAIGERLMQGLLGEQDQAWLSRDPVGGGRLPDEPSPSIAPRGGDGGRPGAPGEEGRAGMFGVPPALLKPPRIVKRPAVIEEMMEKAAAVTEAERAKAALAAAAQDAKGMEKLIAVADGGNAGGNAGGGAGVPGARAEEADPAPQGDSESDAFSTKGSVMVTAGRIEARLGRDVKPVKPRLRIKAGLDVYSIVDASVRLWVKIDATGKVTDVRIVKSSGSNDIDLPTVVAMYKWWIEPPKDKQGKPVADALQITFLFR